MWSGIGRSSSVHVTCGSGLPAAMHLSESAVPGSTFDASNVYLKTGATSVRKCYELIIYKHRNGVCIIVNFNSWFVMCFILQRYFIH